MSEQCVKNTSYFDCAGVCRDSREHHLQGELNDLRTRLSETERERDALKGLPPAELGPGPFVPVHQYDNVCKQRGEAFERARTAEAKLAAAEAQNAALAEGLATMVVPYEMNEPQCAMWVDESLSREEFWRRKAHNRKTCCDVLNAGLRRAQRDRDAARAELEAVKRAFQNAKDALMRREDRLDEAVGLLERAWQGAVVDGHTPWAHELRAFLSRVAPQTKGEE